MLAAQKCRCVDGSRVRGGREVDLEFHQIDNGIATNANLSDGK